MSIVLQTDDTKNVSINVPLKELEDNSILTIVFTNNSVEILKNNNSKVKTLVLNDGEKVEKNKNTNTCESKNESQALNLIKQCISEVSSEKTNNNPRIKKNRSRSKSPIKIIEKKSRERSRERYADKKLNKEVSSKNDFSNSQNKFRDLSQQGYSDREEYAKYYDNNRNNSNLIDLQKINMDSHDHIKGYIYEVPINNIIDSEFFVMSKTLKNMHTFQYYKTRLGYAVDLDTLEKNHIKIWLPVCVEIPNQHRSLFTYKTENKFENWLWVDVKNSNLEFKDHITLCYYQPFYMSNLRCYKLFRNTDNQIIYVYTLNEVISLEPKNKGECCYRTTSTVKTVLNGRQLNYIFQKFFRQKAAALYFFGY